MILIQMNMIPMDTQLLEVNLEEKEEGKRKEKEEDEEEGHQKGKRKANKENNILSYNMGFFSNLLCWLFKGSLPFCKFKNDQLFYNVTQEQLKREQERKQIGGKRRRKTRRKK